MTVSFLHWCGPWEATQAPVDGPASTLVQAALSILSWLKQQQRQQKAHEVGRENWWGIWEELDGIEWGMGLIETHYMQVCNSLMIKKGEISLLSSIWPGWSHSLCAVSSVTVSSIYFLSATHNGGDNWIHHQWPSGQTGDITQVRQQASVMCVGHTDSENDGCN